MVFHYTVRGGPCSGKYSHITLSASDIVCYVGRDKYENEFLIKYGLPSDTWFHVNDLSSAHVYLRIVHDPTPNGRPDIIPIENLPADTISDLYTITKHNSISGSKLASVRIVATPWDNLRKMSDHDTGTVTYHSTSRCHFGRCEKDR